MQQGVLDYIYQNVGIVRNKPLVSCLRDGLWSSYQFADIQRSAQHLSNYLIESGIKSGDRIAFMALPCPEMSIVFFAVVRAGAIFVPLDPRLSKADLSYVLQDSEPRLIFASCDRYEFLNELNLSDRLITIDNSGSSLAAKTLQSTSTHILKEGFERELSETAVIAYTSGASGPMKGVMLSFENLLFQAEQMLEILDDGRKDNILTLQSSNPVLELVYGFLGVIFRGGRVCYVGKISPAKVSKLIRRRRISGLLLSPAMITDLKREVEQALSLTSRQQQVQFKMRYSLAKLLPHRNRRKLFGIVNAVLGSKFKTFVTSGDLIDPAASAFFDTLGIDVCSGYGMVETAGPITLNTHQNSKASSSGKITNAIEVELLGAKFVGDEGEIITRGPHVMQGYYNNSDLTRVAVDQDGWLYTGDLGRYDDDGFLYVTGRIKDVVSLPTGAKFSPKQVEKYLLISPMVRDMCVLGLRKANSFEHDEVVAVVVPSKNCNRKRLLNDLDKRIADLPAYQRPDRLVIHPDTLPKTTSGKVKRWELIDWLRTHKPAELH